MADAKTALIAPWVIPVRPLGVVLDHHAVVIQDGTILDVVPASMLTSSHPDAIIEVLEHHALIPGLVNAHTHAAMALLRGIADDLPLMRWLKEHIWPLEQKWVAEGFVRDGVDLALAEMIRGGVTLFNDMYFYPEIASQRAIRAGLRAGIGLIVMDFPSPWATNAEEYLSKGLALHDDYQYHPTTHFALAPHAPYTVSDESLVKLRTFADELDLPIHMHVHETADEIMESLKIHGKRPLRRLHDLGLLNSRLMAVHMTQLEPAEMDQLATLGVSVIHCPESNLKLGSGFCPVDALLAAGVNIGLGTDGAASNNDLDLMGEMRTAALLAKGVSRRADAVPAPVALEMATLGGARALGLEEIIGSIEPGKSADLTAVRLDALETQPLFEPISHLVYAAGRHQVTDVWVAGKRLLQQRKLTTLDQEDLIQRIHHWQGALRRN